MRRKILVITDNTKEQINGVVTTFKNLELQANTDDYELYFIDPTDFWYIDAPKYPEVKLSLPLFIGKKILDSNPDHVHIATEGPVGLAARLWLDSKKWKYNTSYHTKFPEFIKDIYGIPLSWTYAYVRWFHKHSGRVLTTTETMVRDLKKNNFTGEILAWTRGVDRDALVPSQEWQHLSISGRRIRVLNVGRVSKEKNLDDLCKLQDVFDIEIVGDGPYKQELMKKYPRVNFLGYKQGSELADCYAKADVFCFTSRVDTFGIVIIESLSLGTPVAAYPVPGPLDILEQGITGHMSEDLSDSIKIAANYSRQRVKQNSEKWTWNRCWEIFRDNLVEIN